MQHPGGGAFANADTPTSWLTDRSAPAPPAAPIAFPPKGEIRDPSEVDGRLRSAGGGRLKVIVSLARKGEFRTWPGTCKGRIAVKLTGAGRTLAKQAVKVAEVGTTSFCETSFTIKAPKGLRRATLTASFAGHEHFQPSRVKKALDVR
jgi:hypothetical protein